MPLTRLLATRINQFSEICGTDQPRRVLPAQSERWAQRLCGMLASPNSASSPKSVLFMTLTCGALAMTPTLRQHVTLLYRRFRGEFGGRSNRRCIALIFLRRAVFLTNMHSVRTEELAMSTDATLTSKGQTTIPKAIRDSLHMKTGDRMTFTLMPDGVVIMRVKNKRVSELAGLLHKKGRKPVPVEMLSR